MRTAIASIVRLVSIGRCGRFSWYGEHFRLPATQLSLMTPEEVRWDLYYRLRSVLYTNFYCTGAPRPIPARLASDIPYGITPFIELLSKANHGSGWWEPGWQVRRRATAEDCLFVSRDGLSLQISSKECSPSDPSVGTKVKVKMPCEMLGISPGFYVATGDAGHVPDDVEVLRIYWNVAPRGSEHFIGLVTQVLNHSGVPFRVKVANAPHLYDRCDTAILYIAVNDYPRLLPQLSRISEDNGLDLRQGIPSFTMAVAPGVAVAEDPGDGESFGMHRCGLVAEGLIRAYEAGLTTLAARAQAVANLVGESGLDLSRPHLRASSKREYPALVR